MGVYRLHETWLSHVFAVVRELAKRRMFVGNPKVHALETVNRIIQGMSLGSATVAVHHHILDKLGVRGLLYVGFSTTIRTRRHGLEYGPYWSVRTTSLDGAPSNLTR